MDRNFFLAVGLSFFVLVVYQSIFVVPKRAEILKNTQTNEIKVDTSKELKPAKFQPNEVEKPTKADIKEKITIIKTQELYLEFSNVGGSLHKIDFSGNEKGFPVDNVLGIKGLEQIPFELKFQSENQVSYVYADAQRNVTKTYIILKDKSINASITIENKKNDSRLEDLLLNAIQINTAIIQDKNNRNTMLDEFSILNNNKVFRKGGASKFSSKDSRVETGNVGWVAFRDHFHILIVKPEFETKGYENESVSENKLAINIKPKQQNSLTQSSTYNFTIVAGNQDINWLKTYKKGIEKAVAFSNWGVIDLMAMGIYYTVPALQFVCRSWGIAIILVSLLIYGLTYPLTIKSMSSMKKMQLVQPKVAALQKRYKDDPTKLNSEMVDLYKREGVNPLAGCLPFLLQMPIFIALYQVLWRAYYFQGKSFLWIKDLAQPDRLFILPFEIPFLGNEFNILPILMGTVMFFQQAITSKNMVVTDDTQAMQQKMMKYFFPFFIGFIFYKFASGLSLYFTVFYALSAWTQWKVAKGNVPVPRETPA